MRVSENRILALAVCALCVAISVFGIGGIKLKGEYSEAAAAFSEDVGETAAEKNHNMQAYLNRCAQNAADLSQEAKMYIQDADLIDKTAALAEQLLLNMGANEMCYGAYLDLSRAVEDLYSALQIAGHADEAGVSVAYGNYGSAQDLIKRDAYHDTARAYNDIADDFPAGVISALWRIPSVAAFEN